MTPGYDHPLCLLPYDVRKSCVHELFGFDGAVRSPSMNVWKIDGFADRADREAIVATARRDGDACDDAVHRVAQGIRGRVGLCERALSSRGAA